MISLVSYAKIGAAVIAVLAILWIGKSLVEYGKETERKSARIEAGKRIIEMEKTNETFRRLPARDRCIVFMRDSGLPISECD